MDKKTKMIIFAGIAIVIVAVIVAMMTTGDKGTQAPVQPGEENQGQEQNVDTGLKPGEIVESKSVIDEEAVTPEVLADAKPIAPGASLITSDNIVVTPEGVPVKMNIDSASVEAPRESGNMDPNSIKADKNTIKMSVSAAGFVPNTFTVDAGQLVNFALTSTDEFAHIFTFRDEAMSGGILGVAGGETKMKSWNAPKAGEYEFYCSIPGHAGRGEVGKMIVK